MSSLAHVVRELRWLDEQRAMDHLDEAGEARMRELYDYLCALYPNGIPEEVMALGDEPVGEPSDESQSDGSTEEQAPSGDYSDYQAFDPTAQWPAEQGEGAPSEHCPSDPDEQFGPATFDPATQWPADDAVSGEHGGPEDLEPEGGDHHGPQTFDPDTQWPEDAAPGQELPSFDPQAASLDPESAGQAELGAEPDDLEGPPSFDPGVEPPAEEGAARLSESIFESDTSPSAGEHTSPQTTAMPEWLESGGDAPPEPKARTSFDTADDGDSIVMAGERRVAVHMMSGTVLRGRVVDVDLGGVSIDVHPLVGSAAPTTVRAEQVRAVFFMLTGTQRPPVPSGKRAMVRFHGGRKMPGHVKEAPEGAPGFFFLPEQRGKAVTERVFVYDHGAEVTSR